MSAPQFICADADRDAWLEARRTGIGGSEAPGVIGISPFTTPAKIAAVKRGQLPPGDDVETELMRWGRLVEPLLLETFVADMERAGKKGWSAKVSGKLYRSTRAGREMMIVTVDGQAVDPKGRAGNVECKLKIFGAKEWESEGIPEHVIVQTLHGRDVLDAPFSVVIGLLDGYRPRWKILERDDEQEQLVGDVIVPAEQDFWRRYEAGEPFPMDVGRPEVNAAVLRRLHPTDDGKAIQLVGQEHVDLAREWRRLANERRELEKREKAAALELQRRMGDASYAILDDGTPLANKLIEVKAHQRKASRYRRLDEVTSKAGKRRIPPVQG